MIFTSALIIWKAFMWITGSESPTTVVFSGGMKPGFKRVRHANMLMVKELSVKYLPQTTEDILFLRMRKDPTHAREIVVFDVEGHEIPIAHRVIKGCKYFDWDEPPINDASEATGSERIDKQPDDILAELKLREQGAEVELKEKEAKLRIEMRLELERKEKLAWLGIGILVVYFCVFIVIVKNAIMNRLESSN